MVSRLSGVGIGEFLFHIRSCDCVYVMQPALDLSGLSCQIEFSTHPQKHLVGL